MPRPRNPLIAGETQAFNRKIPNRIANRIMASKILHAPAFTLDLITAEALFAWSRLDKRGIDNLHREFLQWAGEQDDSLLKTWQSGGRENLVGEGKGAPGDGKKPLPANGAGKKQKSA